MASTSYLLCSFGEPEEEADDNIGDTARINQAGRLAHTAILLANRQIYYEAKDVMLRKNQFIRIFTCDIIMPKIPGRIIVHTNFPTQDPIVKNFKGAVMSYYIKGEHGLGCCNTAPCNLIILARDLDGFLQSFVGPDNDLPSLPTNSEHCIVLHDPFEISTDTKYDLIKNQRVLLQPFQNHLRGFTQVKIQGKVNKELAEIVMEEIKNEALPIPDVFLEEVTDLKNKGNTFFREGAFKDATRMWHWGIFKLRRLRWSKLWSSIEEQFGVDFLDSLAELYFTLHNNMAQCCLQRMHELLNSVTDRTPELLIVLSVVNRVLQTAMLAGEWFGTTWQPSARQEAKAIFRCAQAARLAGKLTPAQVLIEKALELQPNDQSLRREATEIRRRMLQTHVR
ncbi:hypothetical protein VSDG_00909 [Cytospora chrysosperma]|uniref:Uncharacterized protein n=1 Tax=Cytospora chrysosperma TaxID=252740 RepID=A0A423WLL3_CYTCH|nr:hypothetical protein VSDG_00909 [Valsa sordida]